MELAKKVAPWRSAVLVVDMQNEFCKPGSAYDKAGFAQDLTPIATMIPRLQTFLASAREYGVPIVYIQAIYDRTYLSPAWMEQAERRRARLYSEVPVCAQGSWGAEIVQELAPLPNDRIVQKHRYSAFINTDLSDLLRRDKIHTVIVTGVGTLGCVDSTARDAFMMDFSVVMVEDCVAMAWGEMQSAVLAQIDALFGEVRTSSEVRAAWAEAGSSAGAGY